jgi:hypothetical protein
MSMVSYPQMADRKNTRNLTRKDAKNFVFFRDLVLCLLVYLCYYINAIKVTKTNEKDILCFYIIFLFGWFANQSLGVVGRYS